MKQQTPPPRKWSSRLGIGELSALSLVIAVLLCMLLPPNIAHATETSIKVSDAQTELFNNPLYITDKQASSVVVESIPNGWATATIDSAPGVYYAAGDYWTSGNAVIQVRYDSIGKIDGQTVSVRLRFSGLKGDGTTAMTGHWILPNGKEGSGFKFNDDNFWRGMTYFGLYQVDCQVELLYTNTGETINMSGGYAGFGSLNSAGGREGVQYVTSNDYCSYTLNSTNLAHEEDGTWRGATAIPPPATSFRSIPRSAASTNNGRSCLGAAVTRSSGLGTRANVLI